MAVTVEASGSQAATVTTEHTLATIAGPGVYQAKIDCSVLQAGDVVELRIKGPALGSGTTRVQHYAGFAGVQPADDAMKTSVPFVVDSAAGNHTVTLTQSFGTSRTFPWTILKL